MLHALLKVCNPAWAMLLIADADGLDISIHIVLSKDNFGWLGEVAQVQFLSSAQLKNIIAYLLRYPS